MRKMGGIAKHIKFTYAMMWIGSLALAGVPFFAGFYSKDIVLESAFAAQSNVGTYAFWMGIAAAVMTAFYSWRLLFMTFHGQPRADEKTMAHVHESPKSMTIPLLVLAIGAMFAGYLGYDYFVGDKMAAFWGTALFVAPTNTALADAHHVPTWVKVLPIVVGAIGIALAFYMYIVKTDLPAQIAARFNRLYLFLYNKWYFDELYDAIFVRPAKSLGYALWREGDGTLIDGLGPDGIAAVARNLAQRASRLQSGYVYHYAFAMLIGVVGLISFYLFTRGG